MTRKDYIMIAETFALTLAREEDIDRGNAFEGRQTTYASGVRLSIGAIADTLQRDNPKFDRKKFIKACGITLDL